ncbi:MAG: response regulator [Gammaproteobacteria bacterium]|nr:response regulator [Gammaproteobacteria bacterium]
MHPQALKTVLIVDDEPSIRLLIKQFLKSDGYAAVEAASGEEAIALAGQSEFDAILLDFNLPGIDGIETCRQIRVMPNHKVTPILVVTAADDDAILNDAFAAGCDDYIIKPINHVVLHARLAAHIHRTELYYQLEQVRKMLNRYVSPRTQLMVEEYAGTGRYPPPEKRDVCVLFTDIRGFTQLSQHIEPERLFALLSRHLAYQVELVYQYAGYVDKYAGDGIMAIFEGPNMALHGCLCAIDIISHARAIMRQEANNLFAVGCGLNLGQAVIGNIGSPEHLDYSAVGETVNLAARLCGLAEPMSIIVSDEIYSSVGGHPRLRFSGKQIVPVKGFTQLVKIYGLHC